MEKLKKEVKDEILKKGERERKKGDEGEVKISKMHLDKENL